MNDPIHLDNLKKSLDLVIRCLDNFMAASQHLQKDSDIVAEELLKFLPQIRDIATKWSMIRKPNVLLVNPDDAVNDVLKGIFGEK